jgi:hypothetical protein
MAARDAIQKVCSFNDLGDLIEGGGDFRKAEMQMIYDGGHEDGFKKGFEKGKEEGRKVSGGKSSRPDKGDILFDDVDPGNADRTKEKILFCNNNKNKLKSREREFIDNITRWTTVLKKNLTPGQENWLGDIYSRLGGK